MSTQETKIELLRKKLAELREERKNIVFEKGLSAEENKDLRENATYDYWDRKEHNITSRILNITREISELTHKSTPRTQVLKKSKKTPAPKKPDRIKDLPKHKWL